MAPTLVVGDWLVVSEVSPETAIKRGDIVIYRFAAVSSGKAVKRVVGLPGDVVDASVLSNDGAPLVVPQNSVFLLGDNRNASVDSRALGPLPRSEIVGRVIWVFHM